MTRPYHPSDGGADPGREPTPEEIKLKATEILKGMDAKEPTRGPGLRCPKCGSQLVHTRLHGYQCARGC